MKRIITPSSDALNNSSFMMLPDLSDVVRNRMPSVSDWWMLACPMSRIEASYRARISVSEEVIPGLSAPEMLICMISTWFSGCMVLISFKCRKIWTKLIKSPFFGYFCRVNRM